MIVNELEAEMGLRPSNEGLVIRRCHTTEYGVGA